MARPVTITIAHELGLEEARGRVRDGFDKIKNAMTGGMMFRFSEEWTGENRLSFTARGLGQTIIGTVDIFPQHVRIEATLPGLLAAIAETISGKVEKEGRLLLERK